MHWVIMKAHVCLSGKAMFWITSLLFLLLQTSSCLENLCDATGSSDTCRWEQEDPETMDGFEIMNQRAQELVGFLKSFPNGHFNDKLEIRKSNNGVLGLFALEDIRANELLLQIPPESKIRIPPLKDYWRRKCYLARKLVDEMNLGDESSFAPYMKYLKVTEPELRLVPSNWSQEGKNLLSSMLLLDEREADIKDYTTQGLPPDEAISMHDDPKCTLINGDSDEGKLAYAIAMRYAYDFVMIPIYDMINHSNDPKKINVNAPFTQKMDIMKVKALKDIPKGQELLLSFDRCRDCEDDERDVGTPELFRDKGIIEGYPQRFHFFGFVDVEISIGIEDISFDVVQEGENESLEVIFLFGRQPFRLGGGIKYLQAQLERLEQFKFESLDTTEGSIPSHEWKLIAKYHLAVTVAIQLALDKSLEDFFEEQDYEYDEKEGKELEYLLPEDIDVISKLDKYRKFIYQAETLVWASDHYEHVDELMSEYQKIEYHKDPNTGDTCFYLDTIFQMCSSYWPYYHEMQVHKPAKYIKEEIKRVLFVGAGDAGLLNEIVKYPSLELVVGLELDQHVTRMAYKHFGAKPHYDDARVQWWYGDASKTLLMLPAEYFGTFDMVLVDLSDTIFALSVSGELDVIGALSLLLRPGGIFAMNELFFARVSDIFQYSIHYQFYDVPKIADQAFVFASNDVDFMKQGLTDHHIEDLMVEDSLLATKHRFHYVHDYRRNPSSTFDKICKNATANKDEEASLTQESSPGIFMALEVEELKWKHLSTIEEVREAVETALVEQDLNLATSDASSSTSDTSFVVVLKEGYVSAHVWPKHGYCAIDILLWSSFEKFESVKSSLIKALGGRVESTSSYRIVTGGMFGVSTWKEDKNTHGPQISKLCTDSKGPAQMQPSPPNVAALAKRESLKLVHDVDTYATVVICGNNDGTCESLKTLEKVEKLRTVIPLYSCSGDESEDDLKECSVTAARQTLEAMSPSKIRVVIIDESAPEYMSEIVWMMNENDFYEKNILILTTLDSRRDLWRRQCIDRVRRRMIMVDPVYRAHVLFHTDDSSLELALVSSGDDRFFDRLNDIVNEYEDDSNLNIEIRNVIGGIWREETVWSIEDEETMTSFYPSSYDYNASLKQWKSQRNLVVQGIAQYTNKAKFKVGQIVEALVNEDEDENPRVVITAVNSDGSYIVSDSIGTETRLSMKQMKEVNDAASSQVLNTQEVVDAFDQLMNGGVTQSYHDLGDGYVQIGLWESRCIILVWDGRSQVDMNVLSTNVNDVSSFGEALQNHLDHLVIKLRDVQPRGYGRVVNFDVDIKEYPIPHWAKNNDV